MVLETRIVRAVTRISYRCRWEIRVIGLLVGVTYLFPAWAAVFSIPATQSGSVFDGQSKGVRPGDTIEIAAGIHGPITFRNIVGSADNPVTIQSAVNGQAIIRRSAPASGGFVFKIEASSHFIVDGSNLKPGNAGYPHGIKIMYASGATSANKDSPTAFLKTSGSGQSTFNNCSNFTIRSIQIDGGWPQFSSDGIGISTNDHQFSSSEFPGARQENIVIEHSDIRNVEGEGMYIGPNYYKGTVPLKNIIIRHNNVENTGWDGIQMKSAIEGVNMIHHNTLKRVGAATTGKIQGEIFGISMLDGPGKIYNNYVERSGDTAIQHWLPDLPASFGPQAVEIYNNVIVDAGITGATGSQGISSGHAPQNRAGQPTADTSPRIYHNTIIRPRGWGIAVGSVSSKDAFVSDNIIVDAAEGPLKVPSNVVSSNNQVGEITRMQFRNPDALDFRLSATSPARNASGDRFPRHDFDGVARPMDGRADQGAFEYSTESDAARPAPPIISSLE